jgi:hypothetical protein
MFCRLRTVCNLWLLTELKCSQVAQGRVSFTANAWSDHNLQLWLCITSHWIAKDATTASLQLKCALIAFHRICGSHDGKNMAEITIQLLD